MGRPRICKECKKDGKTVKMLPLGKIGNMKGPECGSIYKKVSGK